MRSHPATETALVEAYREFRDLSAEALSAVAAQSRRAHDVVRLHDEAHRALAPSWYDEEDLLDAATEVIRAGSGVVEGLGRVVVYLPERLTRHGAALLQALAEETELVVVAGTCGDPAADADSARSVGWLAGPGVEPPNGPDPLWMVDVERTRVVTVSDADEEVRAALRAIVAAVRTGTPLDRIAVLFARPEPYARLAYEQLTAARLTVNGTAVMPLTARVAARTLLGLLALPDGRFRRDDVFAWLAGARVHHRGRWVPAVAWERLSRDAGVVGGRHDWDALLDRLATELDETAREDEEDPEAPEWAADRSRQDAGRARSLREFVLGLIDDLDEASRSARPWPEWSAWARRHMDELLGREAARADWPSAEQRAAERVDRALDRLACLGEMEGPVDLDVFSRTLELELESDLGRVGRMGEGVLRRTGQHGGGARPRPRRRARPGRRRVPRRAAGRLAPARTASAPPPAVNCPCARPHVEKRHRELLAALAGASRHLLCVPRGDLRGSKERVPSRWVLQVASALGGGSWYSERPAGRGAGPRLARARRVVRRRPPALPRSPPRNRSTGCGRCWPGSRRIRSTATRPRGTHAVEERRSAAFTRFDGNLSGADVPSPVERTVSATRLERWANCPFAYLMRDVLGIGEVENPEEQLTITPQHRGSLVHDVLERFIAGVLDRPPAPDEAWGAPDEERLEQHRARRSFADYEAKGLTGRAVFWGRERKRIMADLSKVLELDSDVPPHARHAAAGGRARGSGSRTPTSAWSGSGSPTVARSASSDWPIVSTSATTGRSTSWTTRRDAPATTAASSEDNPDLGGHPPAATGVRQAARALRGTPDDPGPRRVLVHLVEGQVQAHRLRGDAGRPVPGRRVAGRDRRRD